MNMLARRHWRRSCWFLRDSSSTCLVFCSWLRRCRAWHLRSDCSGVSHSTLANFCSRHLSRRSCWFSWLVPPARLLCSWCSQRGWGRGRGKRSIYHYAWNRWYSAHLFIYLFIYLFTHSLTHSITWNARSLSYKCAHTHPPTNHIEFAWTIDATCLTCHFQR